MKKLVSRVAGDACYWICERLCGHAGRRTSCEKLNAASAIAAVQILDVTRLMEIPEERLPELIRHSLPAFTGAEWGEVLALARDDRAYIEEGLICHPEWAHLRQISVS